MTVVEPGKWYFAVTCKNPKCQCGIAIMECPPPEVPVGVDREEFDLECQFCNTSSHYTMHDVTRIQGEARPIPN
jgi:hypothetical protein